ncbi:MAG: Eco57I restriction-modification methylase domain-containing protein [Isosphaeraceae bacterium]
MRGGLDSDQGGLTPHDQHPEHAPIQARPASESAPDSEDTDDDADDDGDETDEPTRGKKTKVEWIEAIPPGCFYLRVGLGRKASGSYYTPHSFVRFLVQETLGPQVEERSPQNDPKPLEILKLRVLDPAMGSGHFLVEACRFLGEKLYEACRSCDEKALEAERQAETARTDEKRDAALEAAQNWRQRIIDLPDPDDELVKTEFVSRATGNEALEAVAGYLPSKSVSPGVSTARAQAVCRRLVAVHCLYGVDKNPLAVELAKLALWLESHAEGMPLTFLDHRLVVGDSLTGPFWDKLLFRPGKPDAPVENLFSQGIYSNLQKALTEALGLVRRLESSVGSDLAEMLDKEAVKARLDQALLPFRVAAAAWAGGVMLGPEKCDDMAYGQLLKAIGQTGRLPDVLESEDLLAQIARGLGLTSVPKDRASISQRVNSVEAVPALGYDLTFPEVFYPMGVPHGREGFHAVLGNPPWDAIQFKSKEFFAAFDFEILSAPTKRERLGIELRLNADRVCGPLFVQYKEEFEQQKRANDVLYEYQKVYIDGDLAGRQADAFRVFMERNAQLLGKKGWTGVVVPSAFHANEGATGVRRLYFEKLNMRHCYSFENKRKLFEILWRNKFAIIVAQAGKPTQEFLCAFYLHDDKWLFASPLDRETLTYHVDFVRRTGGDYLSFLELRSSLDLRIAEACFATGEPFGQVCKRLGIRLGAECHMTNDAWRFTPASRVLYEGEDPRDPGVGARLLQMGFLILHEGKTFRQFDDHWAAVPRYLVSLEHLSDKPTWLESSKYYRAAYRNIAGPGDQNVSIWSLHPAGVTTGEKGPSELRPFARSNSRALWVVGIMNTFVVDWLIQQRIRATVSAFILDSVPIPPVETKDLMPIIVHGSLRLLSNHSGYATLWKEQLADDWRELRRPALSWPVFASDDERWHVRAAIDAVIADAYGLSRDQYAHVLSIFKHTTYPKTPELCLSMFDELKAIGHDTFTRQHDPYWDIPLNESLPQPVIELPIPRDSLELNQSDSYKLSASPKPSRSSRSKRQ